MLTGPPSLPKFLLSILNLFSTNSFERSSRFQTNQYCANSDCISLSLGFIFFFSFFAIIYFALSLRLPLSLFSKCVLSTYIYFERTEKLWAIWKRATMNNNDRERKRKNTNISSRSSRRSWRRRWQVVWENDSHFQHNDKKAMDILYAIIRIKNTYG